MNGTTTEQAPAAFSMPRRLVSASAVVLAFGLYAVGIGDLYTGSTWPDYLVVGLAARSA